MDYQSAHMAEEITGAAAIVFSYMMGVVRGKRLKADAAPEERCQCEHLSAYHDASGCHDEIRDKPLRYDTYDEPTAWSKKRCLCVRYVGPNSSYLPEIDGLDGPPMKR